MHFEGKATGWLEGRGARQLDAEVCSGTAVRAGRLALLWAHQEFTMLAHPSSFVFSLPSTL